MKTYTAKQKGILGLIIFGVIGTPVLAASLKEGEQAENAVKTPATAVAEAKDIHKVTANPIPNQTAEGQVHAAQSIERVPLDKTLDEFLSEQEKTNRATASAQPVSRSTQGGTDIAQSSAPSTVTAVKSSSDEGADERMQEATRRELTNTGLTPEQIAKIERLVASGASLDGLIEALDEKGERDIAKVLAHEKEAKKKNSKEKDKPKQKHEDNGKHKGHGKDKKKDKDKDKDDDKEDDD
ncbi:hypothetical protein [Aneurinibacillus sp. REN35]|uniref:hypothetical protein n=1 Tax=Aneurinibacillus sp. REN35 TaxID=3237286 RepID=UPI0035297B97